jgi:glycosyltransferase involved in cell wall biosynthesis
MLVPPSDVAAFAAALERLLRDATLRSAIAARGPARAELFGVDRMIEGTKSVYRRLLVSGR